MKTSELIEYLIFLEREESMGDLDIRCSDRFNGIVMFPTVVEVVTMAGTTTRFFSLEA